jgi:hypothetical protein
VKRQRARGAVPVVSDNTGHTHVAVALPHFRAALAALPDDPQSLYGLGIALEESGDSAAEADDLLQRYLLRWPDSDVAEQARAARTRLAHRAMRRRGGGALRLDVAMYMAGALRVFDEVGEAKRQEITLEIALLGREGLDLNDASQKYSLNSLPGQRYSGVHLLAMLDAGLKAMYPGMDPGVDFEQEYIAARAIYPGPSGPLAQTAALRGDSALPGLAASGPGLPRKSARSSCTRTSRSGELGKAAFVSGAQAVRASWCSGGVLLFCKKATSVSQRLGGEEQGGIAPFDQRRVFVGHRDGLVQVASRVLVACVDRAAFPFGLN